MKANFYQRKDFRNTKDAGDRRFVVYLRWQKQRYVRTWCDDGTPIDSPARAERICSEINGDIERGKDRFNPRKWFGVKGTEMQFQTYADKWLVDVIKGGSYAPSTLPGIERFTKYATNHFGSTDLREIRRQNIKDYLAAMPKEWKASYKETALKWLSVMLNAAESEYEDVVFCPRFPKVKVPETEIRWLTREWQDRIIAKIPAEDRPLFVFLKAWGSRSSEGRALMWDCVNWEQESVTIRRTFSGHGIDHLKESKTGAIRYLPFTPELQEVFTSLKGDTDRPQGFVFLNRKGKPYSAATIDDTWDRALQDARYFQHVSLGQGTRHSFATQNCDRLDELQTIFGHTSKEMTRRYIAAGMRQIKEFARERERLRIVNGVTTGYAESRVR